MRLLSARIQNFKSLEDVTLKFRDLTIIVGANASGKSNCLEALYMFSLFVKSGSPPEKNFAESLLRVNAKENICFEFSFIEEEKFIEYKLTLFKEKERCLFGDEKLTIQDTEVINNPYPTGLGTVRDENGNNPQNYQSQDGFLALKVAGSFGHKPLTAKLSDFIRSWKFYNFEPSLMRLGSGSLSLYKIYSKNERVYDMNGGGEFIADMLISYYRNKRDCFDKINRKLKYTIGISLEVSDNASSFTIQVWELESHAVKFSSLSDGTLRIIAYCALLYQDDLPPLIAIEEPERNLHPALLIKLAAILKELSQRTQLIVTTHSSQFLDCFTPEELNEDICLLLLSKSALCGTQVFQLDELSAEREDLMDWMENFGIGSAVYHSQLLEEVLEAQYA
ncbi:MAG: AAA family ATPase [Cyanobacteriota bacterium]|jgi:predicted ATPase